MATTIDQQGSTISRLAAENNSLWEQVLYLRSLVGGVAAAPALFNPAPPPSVNVPPTSNGSSVRPQASSLGDDVFKSLF
jgi:hypothetical protein